MHDELRTRISPLGLPLVLQSETLLRIEVELTTVDWSSGAQLWVSICTRSASSIEWLDIAALIQEYVLPVEGLWGKIKLNPEEPMCGIRSNNKIPIPIDVLSLKHALSWKAKWRQIWFRLQPKIMDVFLPDGSATDCRC